MKLVTIDRILYSVYGTFGHIKVREGALLLFHARTLEDAWQRNLPNISCIPAGVYVLKRGNFKGQYDNYELQDVPNRTAIEMHVGNTTKDTQGCILIGEDIVFDELNKRFMVTNSKASFDHFMRIMGSDTQAVLQIRENLTSTQDWG